MGSDFLLCIGGALVLLSSLWLIGDRLRFLRRSTRRFLGESRSLRQAAIQRLHFYVYARWTRQYLVVTAAIVTRLGRRGKHWFADHYHGKVLTQAEAWAVINVQKSVPLQDLEQIIPYPIARDFRW